MQEDIKISTKDKGDISTGWTEDEAPLITLTGIEDNRPLEKGHLSYAMTGKGEEAQYKECRFEAFTEQSGTYTAKIRLGEEEKNLPVGSYEISVKVQDAAGNSVTKTAAYNRDNEDPKGSIRAIDTKTNQEISTLKGTVTICAEADGTGSDLEGTLVKLIRVTEEGEKEADGNLCGKITKSRNFDLDTTAYANGEYEIRTVLKDAMGHRKALSVRVTIANPGNKPVLTVTYDKDKNPLIRWAYDEAAGDIADTEYRIGDGEWKRAEKGAASVSPDISSEGRYKIWVRGTDQTGAYCTCGADHQP